MRKRFKLALACAAAVLVPAVIAVPALASRSIRLAPPGGNTASGTIVISSTEAAFVRFECPFRLTLAAVQERVAKRAGEPVAVCGDGRLK